MPDILIASDAASVQDEVASVLSGPDTTVRAVARGAAVRSVVAETDPDLVVVDLQITSMGGFAVCSDLRLEEGAGRIPHAKVLLLLDRRADVFLARRCGADGWVIKPLDPIRLRRAAEAVLAGDTYEDPSFAPSPVVVPSGSDTLAGTGK